MAERKRVRRNTLERRCLGKAFKLFVKSPKGVFKMLEKIKRVCSDARRGADWSASDLKKPAWREPCGFCRFRSASPIRPGAGG